MKRNLDLIRHILLTAERAEPAQPVRNTEITLDGHTDIEISEHIQLLVQAGFLEAAISREIGPVRARQSIIWRMTWTGYEHLDSIRDPAIWTRTKQIIAARGGSIAFEVVKEIAIRVFKHGLDLPQ